MDIVYVSIRIIYLSKHQCDTNEILRFVVHAVVYLFGVSYLYLIEKLDRVSFAMDVLLISEMRGTGW